MTAQPQPAAAEPAPAPPAPGSHGRLGGGETAVLLAVITAVTVLSILQRPVPAILTAIAAAVCLLLLPHRAGRLLSALATLTDGSRG